MMSLYPHQPEGIEFLASRDRAYLADGMGLGKTIQAILAAREIGARRVLAIAPASAVPNWRNEWAEWGDPSATFRAVSYADRRGLVDAVGTDWDVVIPDEAHYCKNPAAKRSQYALAIAAVNKRTWLLSGTPMPNHPGELYSPLRLWPHVLEELGVRTHDQWVDRFCRYEWVRYGNSPPQRRIFGGKNLDQLRPYLRDIMLRRTEVEGLPPLRVDLSWLPEDDTVARAVAATGLDATTLFNQMDRAGWDGGASKLRRLLGELKTPRVGFEIGKELEVGAYQKIVVLAYHHSVLDMLHRSLADFHPVGFRGDTTGTDRQRAINAFTNDPRHRVFIAQQGAAGVAINLQAASEIVLVEPAWSPDDNVQMIKRIHRIGQASPCRARIFAFADSLDDAIMGVIHRKLRTQRDLGLK